MPIIDSSTERAISAPLPSTGMGDATGSQNTSKEVPPAKAIGARKIKQIVQKIRKEQIIVTWPQELITWVVVVLL